MPPTPNKVTLLKNEPVTVQVDFQSVHHGAFQLYVKTSPTSNPELLKKGSGDTSIVVPRNRLAYQLHYEFVWFPNPQGADFNAVLNFSQKGAVQGTVAVTGKNDDSSVDGDVQFQ